jgi:HD-like signal output (HDOD) protein
VATLARKIAKARQFPARLVGEIYLGALMHDIGKLLLGSNFPDEYREVVRCFGDSRALRETESRLFGTTHAEVGAYLLWLWGVPGSITGIVALHHLTDAAAADAVEPADVVQLADRIVRGGKSVPDMDYLAMIGLPSPLPGTGKPPCGLVTV